jgi:hypothetical protein
MRINRVKNLIPAPNDGEKLYLVVTPLQLGLDKNSDWKGGVNTVTVEVWRQKGKDDPTQSNMGSYTVIVYKNGTSTVKVTKSNTSSFTFQASKSDTSYEIVLKVNSKNADSKTVTISADGITGVGVSSVTEYYLASSSGSGVTTSTSGWTTDPTAAAATLTATKKFLWNYEKVTYTDGTSVNTTPAIIGRYGDKGDKGDQGNTGVSITSVTEYYLASANYTNVTRSTSGWTTDSTANAAKLTASKKYLWNYEVIGYSDGSTDETDPVIIGVYGDKGDKGDQGNTGKGISSITEYYLASASGSGVTTSTSGWTTDPTAAAATLTSTKKYLWNYEKVTYSDGTSVSTTPAIIGRYGDKGDKGDKGNTGVSITSVTEYYLASSAYTGVTRSTSGWTTDPTATAATITASKKYLWNYEVIGYSDGSTDETDPVIIGVYGDKGDKGDQGNTGTGISSTTWYYLATTMATGVTRSTSGWTTSYQQGTPELPYVWRYGDILLTNGTHQYTACELVFSYSAGANPNLLEQTNFSSLQALDKWTGRNSCIPVSGVTVTQESYAAIETGIQAHNAYFDRTYKTTSQIQYKEILQQVLWNTTGTIRKLEPSTWYTFSFWAKGDYNIATFIYPSVFDYTSICYIDGVMQAANTRGADAYINWTLYSAWKRHTFTFKTKSSISGADQSLLFRLYPKSSSSTVNRVYLCMPKLEVGMQATSYISNEDSTHTGQLRRRRWALNTEYFKGSVDERYEDVVLVESAGFYRCIKTHISTLDNRPGTGTYWQQYWTSAQSGQYEMLSTDLFFAEKALINNLIATLIQTGYSGSPHIEAEGSEFKIFGKGQYPAIYLAVNSDNKAVLRFQNENTGEFLYDLGPDGIMKEFSEVADSYTPMKLKKLTSVTRVSELLDITDSACTTYYRFNEGYKQIGSGNNVTKQYHVSGGSSPSAKNAQFFTSQNYNGTTIANGWYVKPNNGIYMMTAANANGDSSIYVVWIYQFSSGKLVSSVPVYFRYTDSQHANHSVGCDENGNELSTSTYTYLYSYAQSQLTP